MNTEENRLIELYADWLKERSTEREIEGGWTELTLPFLDRHNDHLRVFVRQGHDGLRITDEGRTIRDLGRAGCDLKAPAKRRLLAEKILKGLGLSSDLIDAGEIATIAVNGDFPRKLNSVLLSMLAIDGLANVSPSNMAAPFKEDVAGWLRAIGAHAVRGAKFTGRSGVQHEFDFQIPPTPTTPLRVIHSVAVPDKVHIQSLAYLVIDTREAIKNEGTAEFYAALNDSSPISKKQYLTLLSHEITPMKWSKRDEHARRLAG
jgi:hypothetical protein